MQPGCTYFLVHADDETLQCRTVAAILFILLSPGYSPCARNVTAKYHSAPMTKSEIIKTIIEQLTHDLKLFLEAAQAAHKAATHEENQPDNKYDTLALEASYVAQGQANRAQEIRLSIEAYTNLRPATDTRIIRLTSLVTITADDGSSRTVFIGPTEGGMKIVDNRTEITLITPASPLGRELIGKGVGDCVELYTGTNRLEYEIVELH